MVVVSVASLVALVAALPIKQVNAESTVVASVTKKDVILIQEIKLANVENMVAENVANRVVKITAQEGNIENAEPTVADQDVQAV